jgi:hypothetical protein
VTERLRARLEELVVEYARSGHDWQQSLATRFGAVPFYDDLGGCILLSPSGEWVFVHSNQDWLSTVEYEREFSDDWKTSAIRAASRRHPELLELMPERPSGARVCELCDGAGVTDSLEDVHLGCGSCWGKGWV